jgi:hypothetical protein
MQHVIPTENHEDTKKKHRSAGLQACRTDAGSPEGLRYVMCERLLL